MIHITRSSARYPEIQTHHRPNSKNLNQNQAQQKLKRTLPGSWSQGNQEGFSQRATQEINTITARPHITTSAPKPERKFTIKEACLQDHPPPYPQPTQGSQDIRSARTPTSHMVQRCSVTSSQHPHFPRDPRTQQASQTMRVQARPTTQTSAGNHISTTLYSNRSRLPSRFLNQQPPHPTNSIKPPPSKPASHLH